MAFIEGRDVSSYDGNHPSLTGLDFVITKSTEATSYVNPSHDTQAADARAAGLVVGHYHFASGTATPTQQVSHFLAHAPTSVNEFLVLDWETTDFTAAEKDDFLAQVKQQRPNQRVLLYCNVDYWENRQSSNKAGDGLWIAAWGGTKGSPPIGDPWIIHQYTDTPFDKNVANFTTRAAFQSWVSQGTTPPPPDPMDPYANGLPQVNQSSPSAKALQIDLKRVGYMDDSVTLADNYGPLTQSAVTTFYQVNPQFNFQGSQIGPMGWHHLHFEEMDNEYPPASPPPTGDPYQNGLPQKNASTPSAKALQTELKRVGYLPSSFVLVDLYDTATASAVGTFYANNSQFAYTGDQIGPNGWLHLRTQEDTGEYPPGEPLHRYNRLTYNGGVTVNQRTSDMLERARVLLTAYSWTPYLTQGSYNPGVGASAGTHDGGGVVDVRVSTMTETGQYLCVQALRKAGFAAWRRTPAEGFAYHIHAVAIGDREMSDPAKDQVVDFFAGKNGLASGAPDTLPTTYRVPAPAWCNKYNI